MTPLQKFLTRVMPKKWAQQMEAESRDWMMRCESCGREKSVWDSGGIRFKAKGRPRRPSVWCSQCNKRTSLQIYRKTEQSNQ